MGWIGAVVGERLQGGKFEDVLRDGTILCRMIQKLVPGSVPRISTRGGKFEHMENINNFLSVCKRVGIPAVDLFQTVDLYENRNIPAVTQCLNALARKCNLQVESSSSESKSSSQAPKSEQKVSRLSGLTHGQLVAPFSSLSPLSCANFELLFYKSWLSSFHELLSQRS